MKDHIKDHEKERAIDLSQSTSVVLYVNFESLFTMFLAILEYPLVLSRFYFDDIMTKSANRRHIGFIHNLYS